MDDAERARGARLLARLPRSEEHGAWTYAPWQIASWPSACGESPPDIGTVRGADGGQVAQVWPDRPVAMWDADEARAVVWLVNHAAELLDHSAERDRLADTLAWYAATDDADRDADQGRRARDTLRAAGRGDAIAAAEEKIGKEREG